MPQQKVNTLTFIKKMIEKYYIEDLLYFLTEQYWKIVAEKQNTLADSQSWERRFATSSSWICLIACGCDSQSRETVSICQSDIQELTNEMWKILTYASTEEFNKEFICESVENFNSIFEKFSDSIPKEKDRVLRKLNSKQALYEVIRNIPTELHLKALNREIGTKYSDLPILASLLLCKEFESYLKESPSEKVNINDYYSAFIKEKFKMNSSQNFHQTFHLISNIALEKRGIINLKTLNFDASIIKKIYMVLKSLSCCKKTVKEYFDKFEGHFPKKEIIALNNNSFYLKPFLMLDNGNIFLCPSPYILLYTMNWLLINLFSQYIKEKFSLRKNFDSIEKSIGHALGTAYQRYIEKLLVNFNYTFFNLDKADQKNKILNDSTDEKCADFVIITNEYCFIVEVKNSLGLNNFHENLMISLLNRWNRITLSLNQTVATQKNLLHTKNKSIFHLIVVNEAVTIEPAIFSLYHSHSQTNSLSLGEYSIISNEQFENLLSTNSLDDFAQNCNKNAKKLSNINSSNPENIKILCAAQNLLFDPYENIDTSFWDKERSQLDIQKLMEFSD